MTTHSSKPTLICITPELSTEPTMKIHGYVVAPKHRDCLCVKPSEIPADAELFESLQEIESEHLRYGKQLWLISFQNEGPSYSPNSVYTMLTDATAPRPTTEQLSRLESLMMNIDFGIHMVEVDAMETY